MYVYYGIGDKYGYGYVFPKCEHVNLGVGYLLSYFRKYIKKRPWEDHLEFVESLKKSAILAGHSTRDNFHAYLLPVGGPLRRVSTNRIMLVGDAAGFVNGFTAEGIYYAMVSGEHAAATARDALLLKGLDNHALRSYDDRCLAEVGYELRKSVVIQRCLLAHPTRIDKIVALASKNADICKLFTDFSTGKISYSKFKRQVIPKALPFYISYKVSKLWHKLLGQ
jgi:flavin-dependent dehydrogenase